jgi:hypothetical protein
MALSKASFSPGTYWVKNKNATQQYELRADYIWVVIPANTGYSFEIKENLFTPSTLTDIQINRIANNAIFKGV